jgi:hypothetical protein
MRAEMNKNHLVACLALAACLCVVAGPSGAVWAQARKPVLPVAADDGGVTSDQIRKTIQDGIASIRQAQNGDGSWPQFGGYAGATTSLAILAMVNAGVPADDPAIVAGVKSLANTENKQTYAVGLKCQALAAAGVKGDDKGSELWNAAAWLCNAQGKKGSWCYTGGGNEGDNSNTQFAMLGLHEAAKAGFPVPQIVWERGAMHWVTTQHQDGGWTYSFGAVAQRSTLPMTAAGLASCFICGQRLNVGGNKVFSNGAYPDCGKYTQNVVLAAGLESIAKQLGDGAGGGMAWNNYCAYALERVGMIAGVSHFGKHDWYREGAARLARGGGRGAFNYDLCLQILFLAKGNRPVLFQKLEWDCPNKPNEWNRNIHDEENLCAFINGIALKAKPGDEIQGFGKTVTWQSTGLNVQLEQLRVSPVLVITGHEFPHFTKDDNAKLMAYVDSGGVLLFEACCGSQNFAKGFRQWAVDVMPKDPSDGTPIYKLHPLDASHPVFSSMFMLGDRYNLEGIDMGCRTGIFFSPRALSCLWELQTVKESQFAFELGANIAAYATGKNTLADRLDKVELPAAAKGTADQPAEVPRGAVRIARLVHEGDYNADPNAIVNLSAILRDRAKIDVVSRDRHIHAADPALYDYPVLYMTGHYTFNLSDKEIEALRKYLQRGGILVADACCGKLEFDTSFRKMAQQLFPKDALTPLPADHAIYSGKFGVALGELKYRQALADYLKSRGTPGRGTTRPPIEAVTLDGRTAILYSKWDFGCGLQGDNPFSAYGYVDEDAKRLAINLFLYAISY